MPEQPEKPGKPGKPGKPEKHGKHEKPEQATCRMTLAAVPSAARAARAFVGMALRAWQLDVLTEQAESIVSEFATNAVRATEAVGQEACGAGLFALPSLTVEVHVRPYAARIAVRDSSHALPVLRQPAADAEGGRGLLLVTLLSARWGVHHVGSGGKVVWADLAARGTYGPADGPTYSPADGPETGRTDGRGAQAVGGHRWG